MANTRTETDTMGPIEVSDDAYWGAQAQRSLGNFKIGWEKQPEPVIRALGIVKKAAAQANMDLGKMGEFMGDAAFKEISAILKIDPATMKMNEFVPMPMP